MEQQVQNRVRAIAVFLFAALLIPFTAACAPDCPKCDGTQKLRCEACSDGYIECGTCDGTGYELCSTCHGNRNVACERCDGSGSIRKACVVCASVIDGSDAATRYDKSSCKFCGGKGVWLESCDQFQLCPDCHGKKHNGVPCDKCDELGEVLCRACAGTEKVYCHYCNGTGKFKEA